MSLITNILDSAFQIYFSPHNIDEHRSDGSVWFDIIFHKQILN